MAPPATPDASLGATNDAVEKNPDLVKVLVDPFSLCGDFSGSEQPADNKPYEDEVVGSWVTPLIMAVINSKNVHRSNLLLGHPYGEDFEYDEMMIAESALCLVEDCSDLAGGIYTPAPAMGDKLIRRLVKDAGLTFELEA